MNVKPSMSLIFRILLRTARRFNPFYQPIVPAYFTIYLLAVLFTILFIRDRILFTFIPEYKEITISAWGFVFLINFLEAILETIDERKNER